MKRSKQILFSTFGILILLLSIPCLMTYREAMRLERNRALVQAIRQKDVIGVQVLLRQGADPNTHELPETTGTFLQRLLALFDLLRYGQPRAAPDAPSALMLAVEADSAPIVTLLLTAGAKDVNASMVGAVDQDQTGRCPLIVMAARNENVEVVQALLARGVDIEASDFTGATTLIAAASQDMRRDRISGYLDPNRPLRVAAEQNQTAVVRLLLDKGADVKKSNKNRTTALWAAAANDNTEAALLLLDRGSEPNDSSRYDEESPLSLAVGNSNLVLVKALLHKGAKVERPDALSPLFQTTNPAILSILLDHGANIKARSMGHGKHSGEAVLMQCGETVLMQLAYGGSEDSGDAATIIKAMGVLLARGADINAKGTPGSYAEGSTALEWAIWYGGMDIVRYLLAHGARMKMDKIDRYLLAVLYDDDTDTAQWLLNLGANVNAPSGERTPLMETAEWGDEDFARKLLQRGAKVNARDEEGRTALHIAAQDNNAEMVELLLQWGAKVNIRDKNGHTALTEALANDEDEDGEVAGLIREAGGKE